MTARYSRSVSVSGARHDHLRLARDVYGFSSMGALLTALVESVAGCPKCCAAVGQPCIAAYHKPGGQS